MKGITKQNSELPSLVPKTLLISYLLPSNFCIYIYIFNENVRAENFPNIFITNAGEAVTVEDEIVVVNSIVLPNKTLNVSVQEEIIL